MNPEDAVFSRFIIAFFEGGMIGGGKLSKIYRKHIKFVNYAFVAGCGVLINTVILYALVGFFPLYLANWIAIAVAWLSNFYFSVGPAGFLFGLSEKGIKEEKK